MKNLIAFLIIFCSISAPFAQTRTISLDLASIILSPDVKFFTPSFEYAKGKTAYRITLQLGTFMTGTNNDYNISTGTSKNTKQIYKVSGFGIMPEIRRYTKQGDELKGFFIGTYALYRRLYENYDDQVSVETTGNEFLVGGEVGWRWYMFDTFTFEILAGYGVNAISWSDKSAHDLVDDFYRYDANDFPVPARYEISVGYRF